MLLTALVYAQTYESFKECKEEFDIDPVVAKYPNFKNYVETSYMGRISVWATFVILERKLPTHGMNTAAYSENSFGITKDEIFEREKCFNFPDMLNLLLDENSRNRTRKAIQIGNNRFSRFKGNKSRYFQKPSNIKKESIQNLGNKCFIVKSEKVEDLFYDVDMATGFCSCPSGRCCGPCKHKFAIAKYYKVAGFSVVPTMDPKARALFYYLGTGISLPDWHFRALTEKDSETHAKEHIEEVVSEVGGSWNHEDNPSKQRNTERDVNIDEDLAEKAERGVIKHIKSPARVKVEFPDL